MMVNSPEFSLPRTHTLTCIALLREERTISFDYAALRKDWTEWRLSNDLDWFEAVPHLIMPHSDRILDFSYKTPSLSLSLSTFKRRLFMSRDLSSSWSINYQEQVLWLPLAKYIGLNMFLILSLFASCSTIKWRFFFHLGNRIYLSTTSPFRCLRTKPWNRLFNRRPRSRLAEQAPMTLLIFTKPIQRSSPLSSRSPTNLWQLGNWSR